MSLRVTIASFLSKWQGVKFAPGALCMRAALTKCAPPLHWNTIAQGNRDAQI